MLRTQWFWRLAGGLLLSPPVLFAQDPQPIIREIATIPGAPISWVDMMPNRRVVLYASGGSLMAYDLTAKRASLVVRPFGGDLSISKAGDRIVFYRGNDGPGSGSPWTMRINPTTGAPAGPPQQATLSAGDCPSISPDGKLIVFSRDRNGDNDVQDLVVVPTTGGPERVIASYGAQLCFSVWSADGQWIFVRRNDGSASPRTVSIDRVSVSGGPPLVTIAGLPNHSGAIDGRIAFYRPVTVPAAEARRDGRLGYLTASGVRGEIKLPSNAGGMVSRPSSILVVNPEGAGSAIVYEMDIRPLLQALRIP
jgi:hypothetical protein